MTNPKCLIEPRCWTNPINRERAIDADAPIAEGSIKNALGRYAKGQATGRWSQSVKGIGPVLSAGLLAHIDISKARYASAIHRFAGLDPSLVWNKGEKRPWNADLKVLCWKIGESFVKVCNNEDAFYGQAYKERKAQETSLNEQGAFADQARAKLEKFNIGKTTEAYKHYSAGRLPPAHIHARACRHTVKLFLSHWHCVRTWELTGNPPPPPFVIAHSDGKHNRIIEVPGFTPPDGRPCYAVSA